MATALLPFPSFPVHDESTSIGPRWTKWVKRFETYLVAQGITDDKRKRALLLYSAGGEVADIFDTLPDTGDEFKQALEALNKYFVPKVNKAYEVYVFRNASQKPGETLDSYNARLRQLAKTCTFHNEDEEIKSQIVLSTTSARLRRRALRENVSLKDILDAGRAFEISERQAKGIEDTDRERGQIKGPTRNDISKSCFRCGGIYPHKDTPCPAYGKACKKCQKIGHFAKVCRSNNIQRAKAIDIHEDNSTDDEYVYHISVSPVIDKFQPHTQVMLAGQPVKCLIDSGAGINIIDEQTLQQIKGVQLLQSSKKIYAYNAVKPLPVIGEAEMTVQSLVTNQQLTENFCVVKSTGGNLLGCETAVNLGLLRIMNNVHSTIIVPTVGKIVNDFMNRLEGIGKMKHVKAKLHIDKSVKPVAQQHRRVPFHVRDKVEKELQKLEELDIIEKAVGATPWVSPIVVVPKKENIRICVDMRAPNTAIERERHPIPTIEDLIVDLNGATVFTKIDLNKGYHQIELDPDSRHITTFATHLGLFCYKRLSFGINSAAEIFQKAVSDALQGIPGARNISDDIIVFGKEQTDHDDQLKAVLQRLRDNNITANREKCELSKSEITFYGHTFSAKGVSADNKKVSSLLKVSEPQDVMEVRSFLGMAQYIARFSPDFASISAPIRELTHQDIPWSWGPRQQKSFSALKTEMASKKVMNTSTQSIYRDYR
uniref:Uncharacterized protein K02A2.6-like n=1 Tax=Saccoglossus kowalevskii TaxID=10224 RepID=A0ABM0MSD3_SACKO|nr:PREDICTED: uncharacterized protein K02A2.6-like [Saccoglossus kowalevskii]